MAKKKTEEKTVPRPADPNVMGLRGAVVEQPITATLDENYMPYAMSVIVSRAIPEIDGFKPSHRKLLYTMYKMGLLTGSRTKSANIVGQTMRLNPHGDQAIYETMVRLAKGNESLLHPFVDSKGNFGKVYSRDMAYAASRYTEAKLAPICAELFRDLDCDAVDFVDNYDNTMKEPSLLPTTYPNVLVSANQGIAVGMASQICGFNLGEVCDTTIACLKDPDHDIASTLLAPDFPTGGQIICDSDELRSIYATGRGGLKVRARWRYDKKENVIEVYEIPYSTTVEAILDKVAELIKEARGFGDLSENSEYDEAKNEQGKLYSRIAEVEEILLHTVIVDENDAGTNGISIGCRVTVQDVKSGRELPEYKVVGSQEADPMHRAISEDSPFGKALMGAKEGDEVMVEAPVGTIVYRIVKIER